MDTLTGGNRLDVNQYLQSNNGWYRLIMQGDGNLVLYEGIPNSPKAYWDAGTWALPVGLRPTYALMQGDGNFVLYNGAGVPEWASGTDTHPGAQLVLQDDRNLVIYDQNGKALWASNTWVAGPAHQTEVHAHKEDQVGYGKKMTADATLYRNGSLVVDSWQQNDNLWGGLRGQILVVCVDGAGRAIWVSQVFQCATRCSIPDVSCASYGRQTFTDQFPGVVGEYTSRLDIHQGDEPHFADLRSQIVKAIKETADIVKAVKDALSQLA